MRDLGCRSGQRGEINCCGGYDNCIIRMLHIGGDSWRPIRLPSHESRLLLFLNCGKSHI